MSLKCVLAAVLSISAGLSVTQSFADDYRPGYSHRHRSNNTKRYRHYSTARGAGGQEFGDQHIPYIYYNGPYSNSPYFENRTFWERVQTQADYPVR